MPFSKSTSSVTWGRLSSSRYWMNCFGALGSASFWGSPEKFTMRSMSSSFVGFFLNFTNTAAVCPLSTGTRMHWQVITGSAAFTMTPSSICPQSRKGSCSLFSSSPPM